MKIVYTLGWKSQHDNQELRWSLRGLERYAADPVEVIVVGQAPKWFKGEVIECDDPDVRPHKNILRKIVKAIESGIDEPFLISSDDHFLLRELDFSTMPRYWKREALHQMESTCTEYQMSCAFTRMVLAKCGYPFVDYGQHFNYWVRPEDLAAVMAVVETAESRGWYDWGLEPGSLWNNVAVGRGDRREIAFRSDIKFGKVDEVKFRDIVRDADGISISDAAFMVPEFVKFMTERFSEKSKWEE